MRICGLAIMLCVVAAAGGCSGQAENDPMVDIRTSGVSQRILDYMDIVLKKGKAKGVKTRDVIDDIAAVTNRTARGKLYKIVEDRLFSVDVDITPSRLYGQIPRMDGRSIDIFSSLCNSCVKAMWKRTQELPYICDFRLKQLTILRREMERIADAKPKPDPPNFEGVHPTLDMVQSTLKTSLRRAYEDMLWHHPFEEYYKCLPPEEKRSWEKRIEEASGMPLEFLKF